MGDRRLLMRLGYLMIFLLMMAVMGFAILQPIKVLPRLSLAPGYSFVNQEGNRFTSESLRGSLVLYTFSYSHCTSPCIPTSATLASLRSEVTDVPTAASPSTLSLSWLMGGASSGLSIVPHRPMLPSSNVIFGS